VDVLVNAAGIMGLGLTEDIEEEDWDLTMAINLKGVLFFSQAVIPTMEKQRSGKIVSIGSLNAKGIGKARADYKASKTGIHALTMAIAREIVPFNINVNAIAPKLVLTPMSAGLPEVIIEEAKKSITLGRADTPEEVTNAVLFLVSEKSSYITRHILDLNGGLHEVAELRFGQEG
jgi:3-oxoacyl-[acyl-carrier protein] reductase